jgi:hypothetical protein
MDEVIVNQIKYISSKRAAKMSGYARDYIGQLVRMGKLKATKVGRAWFVDEKGIIAIISGKRNLPSVLTEDDRTYANATPGTMQATATVSYPKTWSQIHYMHDDTSLLPTSDSRDMAINNEYARTTQITHSRDTAVEKVRITKSSPVQRNFIGSARTASVSVRSMDGVRVSVREIGPTNEHFDHSEMSFVPVQSEFRASQTKSYTLNRFVRICATAVVVSIVFLLIPIV